MKGVTKDHQPLVAKVVTYYYDGDFTTVEINLEGHRAVGVAKRHPDDTENETVGAGIAIARAFENLGKELRSAALEMVRKGKW